MLDSQVIEGYIKKEFVRFHKQDTKLKEDALYYQKESHKNKQQWRNYLLQVIHT